MRTDDLAAHALSALMQRHPELDPSAIGDFDGCANQAEKTTETWREWPVCWQGCHKKCQVKQSTDFVPWTGGGCARFTHAAYGRCQRVLAGGVEHYDAWALGLKQVKAPSAVTWSCMTVSVGGSSTHVLKRFMAQG